MMREILLADPEPTFRRTLLKILRQEEMAVTVVANGTDAINAVVNRPYAVAILDEQMPGADGIKVLREIMKVRPETRVIIMTAEGTVEMAVEAIGLGACDYVTKSVIFRDILTKIRESLRVLELREKNAELKREWMGRYSIVGQSEPMQKVFEMIRKAADTDSNVLVTGESGTGKELVARAIHSLGSRKNRRFTAVNCSAIPETLFESELFGHKKGSFTSACEDKKGLFESAHGGTLLLDEIGDMPVRCQVKLLRAVESGQVQPVGSSEPVDVDMRLIATTNRDLLEDTREGRFREDLYYRMNVISIHLPPLRARTEDVPLLVEYFLNKYNAKIGKNCVGYSDDAMKLLVNHEWRGNIREMQNTIERAVIFAEDDLIKSCDIGLVGSKISASSEEGDALQAAVEAYEKYQISQVLKKYHGDKINAAKTLGISLSSLYRKIKQLRVDVGQYETQARVG